MGPKLANLCIKMVIPTDFFQLFDQILAEHLCDFWVEYFLEVVDLLVMQDGAPVYKGVA
jgi:hypothetical protein